MNKSDTGRWGPARVNNHHCSLPRFTHEMASVSEAYVEFLKDGALKKAFSESGDYRDVMSFPRSQCISVCFSADNLPDL